MSQVFPGRAKSDGGNSFFACIVAAVGAKAILGKFRIVACLPDFSKNFLNIVFFWIIVPAREKALTLNFRVRIAFLFSNRKGSLCRKLRIFFFQPCNQFLNRSQEALFRLTGEKPAVQGGTAVLRHHRSSWIWGRNNIRHFHDSFSKLLMDRWLKLV